MEQWQNLWQSTFLVCTILCFNNFTLNLNQHLHSTIAVRSVWLEIACPTAYYADITGGWADPKTASARVQCCNDDGECKRKNDNDECYWQGNAKFYAARKICKSHGKRLCTKAEILSLSCCKKGCKMNPKLAWTSDTSAKGVVRENYSSACSMLSSRCACASPIVLHHYCPHAHEHTAKCYYIMAINVVVFSNA